MLHLHIMMSVFVDVIKTEVESTGVHDRRPSLQRNAFTTGDATDPSSSHRPTV